MLAQAQKVAIDAGSRRSNGFSPGTPPIRGYVVPSLGLCPMTNMGNKIIEGNTPTLILHLNITHLSAPWPSWTRKHARLHLSHLKVFNFDGLRGRWCTPIDLRVSPGPYGLGHTHLTYSTSRSGVHFSALELSDHEGGAQPSIS